MGWLISAGLILAGILSAGLFFFLSDPGEAPLPSAEQRAQTAPGQEVTALQKRLDHLEAQLAAQKKRPSHGTIVTPMAEEPSRSGAVQGIEVLATAPTKRPALAERTRQPTPRSRRKRARRGGVRRPWPDIRWQEDAAAGGTPGQKARPEERSGNKKIGATKKSSPRSVTRAPKKRSTDQGDLRVKYNRERNVVEVFLPANKPQPRVEVYQKPQ